MKGNAFLPLATFIIGTCLYALDGILLLLASRWIDLAFHGVALFFLFRGVQACRAAQT